MLKERTGSSLEYVAVVELEDCNDVAVENARCAEDDDARPLYFVVPDLVIASSSEAYADE